MKKKTTLISMIALVVLMTACSSNNVGTSKDGGGQAASPNVKVDRKYSLNPQRMPTNLEALYGTFCSMDTRISPQKGLNYKSDVFFSPISL